MMRSKRGKEGKKYMKDDRQLGDQTPGYGVIWKGVIIVILAWAVVSLTPLGQEMGIDNGKAALAASVPSKPVKDSGLTITANGKEEQTQSLRGTASAQASPRFSGHKLLFERGRNRHNVGSGEWWVDINGDGLVDYVNQESGRRGYFVNLNLGNGEFERKEKLLFERGNNNHSDVGTGEWWEDINGDGWVDHVYNHIRTRDYHAHLNLGGNKFQYGGRLFQRGSNRHNVGSGEWWEDINGDGLVDYVNQESGRRGYFVNLNLGNGEFEGTEKLLFLRGNNDHSDIGTGEWWEDINGDGWVDHVYNHRGTRDYHAHLNLGGNNFQYGGRLFQRGRNRHNVGSGEWWVDINGDGLVDYVNQESGRRGYFVNLNLGNGEFEGTEKLLFLRGNNDHSDIGTGEWWVDINGDGWVDHVYNHIRTRDYHAHLNLGGNKFQYGGRLFQRGSNRHDVETGKEWWVDIDGDGWVDHVYNERRTRNYRAHMNLGAEN